MKIDDDDNHGRAERLAQVLDHLKREGLKQGRVAIELSVPQNYLSDLKHERRVITEPFARMLSGQFGVSYTWFWAGEGRAQLPRIRTEGTRPEHSVMLPILSQLHEGPPRQAEIWDGSLLELCGRSAEEASKAANPYILRVSTDDITNWLPGHSLLLISQDRLRPSGMAVVRSQGKLLLARKDGQRWINIRTGRQTPAKAEIIGHALGIVWAPL